MQWPPPKQREQKVCCNFVREIKEIHFGGRTATQHRPEAQRFEGGKGGGGGGGGHLENVTEKSGRNVVLGGVKTEALCVRSIISIAVRQQRCYEIRRMLRESCTMTAADTPSGVRRTPDITRRHVTQQTSLVSLR